jgi:hypothetical protein
MFPLLLGIAILGCFVAIFFLRSKRKPLAHTDQTSPGSHIRASRRIAHIGKPGQKVSALTEEPKPLRTGTFNKEKTGANRNQLEQIKKVTTVT